MSDEASYDRTWEHAAFASAAAGTDGTQSMVRRLRRIEKTLGVRFDPDLDGVLGHGTDDRLDSGQQMHDLLHAFCRIKDDKMRQNVVSFLKYTAEA